MEDLCRVTEQLWNIYFNGEEEDNLQTMQDFLDPECVIIGTGKHEFYSDLSQFLSALHQEMEERKDINFQAKDFWCKQKDLSPEVSLVYGGIYIWGESPDQMVTIDMDSRFSVLYRKEGEHWKVVHIHQSMPNREQLDGEYYPKTLSQQIINSQEKIKELKNLAERDSLTNLINFRTFQSCFENWEKDNSWLFIIDVDKFKQINDVYGHVTGNHVLQKMADTLESSVRSSDIVCRMGGDEFLILCGGLDTERKAQEFLSRLKQRVATAGYGESAWTSISVGMVKVEPDKALNEMLSKADIALYTDKKSCSCFL